MDLALILLAIAAIVLHLVTAVAVAARRSTRPVRPDLQQIPVTLIRPVCGLDATERETIASSFHLSHGVHEVIFCCACPNDPAVAFIQELMRRHPEVDASLLIGDEHRGPNPKLDNMAKGWDASKYEWVVFADSNLMLPPDYLALVLMSWREDTGLVCAPPIGAAPQSFWSQVECVWLNTYQARWQYAADAFDYGFAQGKTMLWRRSQLMAAGGIGALSRELAEDAAATKLVRGAGFKVRLAEPCIVQPLGVRTFEQVMQRQVRWAQVRRMPFPIHYAFEIGSTGLLPIGLAAVLGWRLSDDDETAMAAASAAAAAAMVAMLWYGTELVLAARLGWWVFPTSILAMIVRDCLIPVVWLLGWGRNSYVWRGNKIRVGAWSEGRRPV